MILANSISTDNKKMITIHFQKLDSKIYYIKLWIYEDGFYRPSNIISETKAINKLSPEEIIDKYVKKLMDGLEYTINYNK